MRKTDKEILQEYCKEMEWNYPTNSDTEFVMLYLVNKAREEEPKINSGMHLVDFCSMFSEESMESYYGSDYFDRP